MCGIAGILTVERPVSADVVSAVLRMLDRQIHRGPDDWGVLIPEQAAHDPGVRALLEPRGWEHVRTYPGSSTAPAVVLGARRLSIIDLSVAGRMPMVSKGGRVAVVYNGEIYNFKELRGELMGLGHSFSSNTDTEVLLHGYQQWGDELPTRLRGMFVFAVLDVRERDDPKLFLAKDRYGIKPLYWARHRGVFQFASEVRALMATGLIPSEPEPRGFHGFLMYGSVPTPWTTVRDVFSLPGARTLTIDRNTYAFPRATPFWSRARKDYDCSFDQAAALTRQALDDAVRSHLISDVPVGVFLSGGMDSSAIVALASRHVTTPLTTISVVFDEPGFSERQYADMVARQYGTRHVVVPMTMDDFSRELPQILGAMDQPTADGVNSYFVAKAARDAGLKVVLSGVGGDEIFWGYAGFRLYPALRRLRAMPLSPWLARAAASVGQILNRPRLQKAAFLAEDSSIASYLAIRGLFPPAAAAKLLDAGELPPAMPTLNSDELGESYQQFEFAHYLQNQLLRDIDVFSMAHSVEVRVPFLDRKLVDLVSSFPVKYHQSRRQPKPLLARALRDVYPPELAARRKMGFTFPFDAWIRGSWEKVQAETHHDGPIREAPAAEVVRAFTRRRMHWSRVWSIQVIQGLARRGAIPRWPAPSSPRRVLFLLPQVYGSKGGIPVYNQALLRGAAEALPLSELHLVSLNDSDMPPGAQAAGRVHFRGFGPRSRLLFRTRFALSAVTLAIRRRPDLIVAGHMKVAPLLWFLGRLTGSPTALIAHGIEAWQPAPALRWSAKRSDRILAVSGYTATRVAEWTKKRERITILPNMVDEDVFRPMHHRNGKTPVLLLTVARLDAAERYKGVDRVLEALPAVLRSEPSVRYIVAGTGDDVPRLRRAAEAYDVSSHVDFVGFVPDEDLPRLYSEADVFVMPSKKEGFGIVFLEALACGTPVVAGNRDGSIDALLGGRVGTLVDPDDTGQIATAIIAAAHSRRANAIDLRSAVVSSYGVERFRSLVAAAFQV